MARYVTFVAMLALISVGHAAIWITANNRAHALGWPRWCVKTASLITYAFLVLLPALGAGWLTARGPAPIPLDGPLGWAGYAYFALCAAIAVFAVPPWWWRNRRAGLPALLRSNHTRVVDIPREIGHHPAQGLHVRLFARAPGNQVFELHIHEEVLEIPSLPAILDGLTITHLSDLHLKGHIGPAFHEEVVRQANDLGSDLIVLTGDLIETEKFVDQGARILGRLRGEYGVYFVLGNHDARVRDTARLRGALAAQGLVDLGGRYLTRDIRGVNVLLAGNELPWFTPAADVRDVPPREAGGPPFRVLLTHSPDQFAWARRRAFDLVLAGHNHGGQIQFPGIGPVVAPSRYGVRYHSGVFHEPPSVMHVSRGVSGLFPLRWRCPPELAKLTLRAPAGSPGGIPRAGDVGDP